MTIEAQPHVPQLFVEVASVGGVAEARIRFGAVVIGYVCEAGQGDEFITPLGAKMAAEEAIAHSLFGLPSPDRPVPAINGKTWFLAPPRGWAVPVGTRPGEQDRDPERGTR